MPVAGLLHIVTSYYVPILYWLSKFYERSYKRLKVIYYIVYCRSHCH